MNVREYLFSLPERAVRSASAIAGGLVRELGDATLPAGVRRTRLYRTMVLRTLRFMIEQVGQVEGTFPEDGRLAGDFLMRRAAGDGIDLLALLTFHASPVWVMAALADLSGTGRQLIQEISSALKDEGLLEKDAQFETVDQMLDGLERSAGRFAETINAPPLDVKALRKEWQAIRAEVATIGAPELPGVEALTGQWRALASEAAEQKQSVFRLSSAMAVSAVANLPQNLWWLSRAGARAARKTGEFFADPLLVHYAETLAQIRSEGFAAFWGRQFRPYLKAAAMQFSPARESFTEKWLRGRR
ncbi:MAG: hypothetical protein ABI823_20705 [Bryobacteraceae bacterium]